MGTLHAWESFGDGASPDIQAVAKGLGGGYASIGAVLMSKKFAQGIRDKSGFMKHGHTYQVIQYYQEVYFGLISLGTSPRLCSCTGRPKSD